MKVMLSIDHPAWAHQFHNIVWRLDERGDSVRTLAIDKDGDLSLLQSYHIPYELCCRGTGSNVLEKGWLFIAMCFNHTWHALRFKPDILIGRASPMMAVAAWVARKPHLLYEDTEISKFSLRICKHLSTKILTPRTFLTDLGPVQERVDTYKELFYLHPSVFTPDRQKLRDVGFNPDESYVLVRFVAWKASHDMGKHGIDNAGKIDFIQRLAKLTRVYISSEGELPPQLEGYRLKTPFDMVHHVVAFAKLVISDGATMPSEAVVLGTYALYINDILPGSIKEQNERYELIYIFSGEKPYERALDKADELLHNPKLEELAQAKRQKLLSEKTDINDYFLSEMDRLAKAGRKGK